MLAALVVIAGCSQEMDEQPRVEVYEVSPLDARDTSARHPVAGTIARGHEFDAPFDYDVAYRTGKSGGELLDTLPERLLEDRSVTELLRRGRERYAIFCSPCHDLTGHGNGIVPQRGFRFPPSYHVARLRDQPIGYFFEVATHGRGAMPAYASQIPVEDRWAIAAYVRALQFSQHAPVDELPDEDRQQLPERRGEHPD